ncbi:MAG: hypothetical protein ACKE9I_01720 [Methylophagaceae bacterium]
MPTAKRDHYSRKHRPKQLLLGRNSHMDAAKVTMSSAGKNQNTSNNRWAKTIEMYHDFLIDH